MARFVYPCPLRWSDVDLFRHVNNVAYLRFLEEGRIAWLYRRGEFDRVAEEGVLVVRHEIDYRRQLQWRPEPLPIEMWVSRIGNGSFAVSSEMVDTDDQGARTVYAQATTVLATVNLAGGHPTRVSPEFRAFLARYTDED